MKRYTHLSGLLALTLLLVAVQPAAALHLGGHDRDGTVVGLNIGGGWNRIEFGLEGERTKTNTEFDFSGGINVGWARSDHLIASIGIYGWKEIFYVYGGEHLKITNFHFLAELTWFPRGEGFWIKGGAGGGSLDFDLNTVGNRHIFKKGGWNFSGGTGYEFRVSDEMAFGFAYDFRFLTVGDFGDFEDTKVFSHNASASLRFYM